MLERFFRKKKIPDREKEQENDEFFLFNDRRRAAEKLQSMTNKELYEILESLPEAARKHRWKDRDPSATSKEFREAQNMLVTSDILKGKNLIWQEMKRRGLENPISQTERVNQARRKSLEALSEWKQAEGTQTGELSKIEIDKQALEGIDFNFRSGQEIPVLVNKGGPAGNIIEADWKFEEKVIRDNKELFRVKKEIYGDDGTYQGEDVLLLSPLQLAYGIKMFESLKSLRLFVIGENVKVFNDKGEIDDGWRVYQLKSDKNNQLGPTRRVVLRKEISYKKGKKDFIEKEIPLELLERWNK